MIVRIQGDLFNTVKYAATNVIIPHVCNNVGAWGAGFVLPLAKAYPKAREKYLRWSGEEDFKLGNVQFVEVTGNVTVANMVAQNGITNHQLKRPLRYDSLVLCMMQVLEYADQIESFANRSKPVIHCPKFGSGLAGGNWEFIEYLIQDIWNINGLNTVIYSY